MTASCPNIFHEQYSHQQIIPTLESVEIDKHINQFCCRSDAVFKSLEEKVALLTAEVAALEDSNKKAMDSNKALTETVLRSISLLDTKCEKCFVATVADENKKGSIDGEALDMDNTSKSWTFEPPKPRSSYRN